MVANISWLSRWTSALLSKDSLNCQKTLLSTASQKNPSMDDLCSCREAIRSAGNRVVAWLETGPETGDSSSGVGPNVIGSTVLTRTRWKGGWMRVMWGGAGFVADSHPGSFYWGHSLSGDHLSLARLVYWDGLGQSVILTAEICQGLTEDSTAAARAR